MNPELIFAIWVTLWFIAALIVGIYQWWNYDDVLDGVTSFFMTLIAGVVTTSIILALIWVWGNATASLIVNEGTHP